MSDRDPHSRLRQRLADLIEEREGLNWAKVSKLAGLGPTAVRDIITGRSRSPKHETVAAIARVLKVPTSELTGEDEGTLPEGIQSPHPEDGIVMAATPLPQGLPKNLPVYGQAEAGQAGEFEMNENGDVVAYVERPAALLGVRDAYAIYMVGNSMSPVLQEGWLLHVNPHRPPSENCYVVVQLRPREPNGPLRCFVKQYIKKTPTKLVCRQYNPEQTVEYPLTELLAVHRVIGIAEM